MPSKQNDAVDAAGMEILRDMHRAEQRAPKPKKERQPESKGFSKQTNILITIGAVALMFIVIFSIRIVNQPEVVTPDELHAKNLAGKLDPEQGYVYRGFSFVWYDNLWFTQMHKPGTANLYNIQLHFSPRDLRNVSLGPEVELFARVPSTYITFDPLDEPLAHIALAAGELSLNLAVVLNITPVPACTRNETAACRKLDIINCESDFTHPIIYLHHSPEANVTLDGNCLHIAGNNMEIVRAADRALLLWMGIMPREGESI
ncbi:MAG TPA: hypothetical protein VJK52_01735 [Candidatus Nanoarchaeia archaeon]|nr:hypothetical protein [Candidatus Nanoarchaeia archaeon]